MRRISFKEFSTGISYLQSPDEEIQQLGVTLFDLYNIKFHKLYSYFTVNNKGWVFTITPTEFLMGDSYSHVDLSIEYLYKCITGNWEWQEE